MARRTLLVSLFMVLSLVLAACGPGAGDGDDAGTPEPLDGAAESPAEASPAEGGEASPAEGDGESPAAGGGGEGEIFAFGFSYDTGDTVAKSRVDYFREQSPDIDVTFSESGFEAQPFLAALQGSDPPDVANIPRNVLGSYVARGVLAPLDDCIEQSGVDTAVFYESALQQVTVDDTVYALPEFFNTRLWLVNDTLFQEAGLDPAEFDFSDWDAIRSANEAILQLEGGTLTRIGIDPKIPEFLAMWVRANGGQVLSDDGRESLLDTPEVAEALQFAVELIDAQGGGTTFLDFRNSPEYGDFFGAEGPFVVGSVGAFPMEQWYLNVMADNSPDAAVSGHAFLTREGDPITLQDGNSWAIIEGTDQAEAACEFITTMVSQEAWIAAAEARAEERAAEDQPSTGVYTANRDADEEIFGNIVDLSDYPNFEEAVQVVLDNHENAFGFPPSPAGEEFIQALEDAVDRALTGEDPAQALQDADAEAQDAIDTAGE